MVDFEINKRLKYLITEVFKTTPHAFSQKYNDKAGVKTSQILRERNGLSMQMLEKIIQAYPEINRTWLLTGEGNILNSDRSATVNNPNTITMPADVWEVIKNQAESLKIKDLQTAEVIGMLKDELKKKQYVGNVFHVVKPEEEE